MQVSDFDFELPPELIANFPAKERTSSRLLVVDGPDGVIDNKRFSDVIELISEKDLLVFNDTKVVPARLFGKKASGGKLEILFERVVDSHTFLAHVRSSRSPKPGSMIFVDADSAEKTDSNENEQQSKSGESIPVELEMLGREGALFVLRSTSLEAFELLETFGHIPLPPYIERADQESDHDRYQTVYADKPGAAAAPTAGLHFDDALLESLKDKGVRTAFVTLHVGAGTFQPVKVDKIEDHQMHSEWIEVKQDVVDAVNETRAQGGRVICVGTTSVRSLESASLSGKIEAFTGDTSIFIYPGYEFKSVDALITNFHLPKSTLLMLVSAFSGKENMLNAYRHAVKEKYRFFSYGDAMFLNPKGS